MHHLLEYMGIAFNDVFLIVMGWQWGKCTWKCSPYIQVSDVLCYKPIPIMNHLVG